MLRLLAPPPHASLYPRGVSAQQEVHGGGVTLCNAYLHLVVQLLFLLLEVL